MQLLHVNTVRRPYTGKSQGDAQSSHPALIQITLLVRFLVLVG